MDLVGLFKSIITQSEELVTTVDQEYQENAMWDIIAFLAENWENIKQYAVLLHTGQFAITEFELFAKNKRDLATMAFLKKAGFGLENLDELKTKLIQLIIDTTIQSESGVN
jgi:hypothetical protein